MQTTSRSRASGRPFSISLLRFAQRALDDQARHEKREERDHQRRDPAAARPENRSTGTSAATRGVRISSAE